jgi:beta-lactamase regulating signal transducer with metallopeptidase domain/uncharacterized protein YjbI with pentapeptide repeats/Leucine-rich repeat (LRR) protein
MNAIHLPPALVETLGWALVHSVWQLALIAMVAALLTLGMGRCAARTRYAMLVVALAAMTAAPVATLLALRKPEPVVVTANAMNATAQPVAVILPAVETPPAVAGPAEMVNQRQVEQPTSGVWDWLASLWTNIELAVRSWSPTIVGLWCLGVCLFAWRPALSWREVGRLRRVGVSPAPDGIRAALNILARRMGLSRTVQILESTQVRVPVVVGYLRPMILLPVSLASQLSVPQLEAILAHELAHVRRHDYLVNLWQILVETALFYHPAVWWLSHRIRVERENCCDDIAVAVVEDRVEYCRALLAVAEIHGPQTTLALGARGGSLLARVRRLFPGGPGERRLDAGNIVALGLLATSIVALAVWATAVAKEPDGGETKDGPATAEHVLHFPADRVMGIVYVRESNEKGYAHDVAPKEWKKIGEARGEVRVPAGKEVRLELNKAASGDLSGLDQLAPDDLAVLSCRDTDVDDKGLPHIGRLSGLIILQLDQTRITDAGFGHLSGLTNLRFVDLGAFNVHKEGFGVGDAALKVLAGFPKLETIRLRDTKVTGAGLATLAPLKSLANLNLSGTKTGDEGLANLKQLPSLVVLQLGVYNEGAGITDEGLKTLGELVNLTYLTLSGNKISDAALVHLKNLSRLKDLSLDHTGITEDGLANLEPLQALENLRLYTDHKITDVGAAHLAKLKSLRRLTDNLILTDAGLASLATLPHLEHLSLSDSKITMAGARTIAGMKSLTWLHFHDCPIGDDGLAAMCDLPNVEYLQLSQTGVSGDGLKDLERMPRLSVLILDFGDRNEQPAGLQPHLREIAKLSHLKDLRIRGWGLDSSDLKEIAGMLNLQDLNVDMPLDDEGAQHIGGLRNLQTLEIHDSVLTDAGLKQLANLGQLTSLDLEGHFTDRGLASLAKLQSLWGLQVRSPYITKAGLRALERQLPALQFCSEWGAVNDQAEAEDPLTNKFYIGGAATAGDDEKNAAAATKTGSSEVTILASDANEQGLVFFDIETGKTFKPPFELQFVSPPTLPEFVTLTPEIKDWIKTSGVDILFHINEKHWAYVTLGMRINFIAQPNDWKKATLFEAMKHFEQQDAQGLVSGEFPTSSMGADYREELGHVDAFRTRDKAVGVMRWTGISKPDRGVKIQYRLMAPAAEKLNPSNPHSFEIHQGAKEREVVLDEGLDNLFASSDFAGADFARATLVGAAWAFRDTRFSHADLTGASLSGDNAFQQTQFDGATLTGATLKGGGSSLQLANFDGANLDGALLSGNGQMASFVNANMAGASFTGDGTALQTANFDGADLTRATIRCPSAGAFQLVSINRTNFADTDLSSLALTSLNSSKFSPKTPPTYTKGTKFPSGFNPLKAGWKLTP